MGYASQTLDERRHMQAELEHLREFYLYWAQMHAICTHPEAQLTDKQSAAQRVVDKSRLLKEFYA